jgi:hypothetical protein
VAGVHDMRDEITSRCRTARLERASLIERRQQGALQFVALQAELANNASNTWSAQLFP